MATDQITRLEAATVKAENGSDILYRVANGAAGEVVTTLSGDVPTVAGKMQEISDMLAISSGIYPTAAAGLAATSNGQVFLLYAEDDDDIIYRVYQNQNGTAFDTGKNTISGTDLEQALAQASQAATSAQQSADTATQAAASITTDLSNSTDPTKGSALIGYSGRTVAKKLSDYPSIQDFGAKADGTTDDTQAFLDGIASMPNGGVLTVPRGNIKISAPINNSTVGVSIIGANKWGSRIFQADPAARIISNTAMFFSLQDVSLDYQLTPTGGQAIYSTGSYSEFRNFSVRKSATAVYLTQGVAQRLINFDLLFHSNVGLHLKSLNDVFVRDFIINAGNSSNAALGNIRLEDKVEALVCQAGDVLLGVYPITFTAASFTQDNRPAYNRFTDVYFDTGKMTSMIANLVETDFVGCWFSGGRTTGAAAPGADIFNADSVRFTNTIFFNCGSHGANLQSSAKKTSFVNCSFESNSITAGDGVAHGLNVQPNTTDFTVIGGKASNGLYTGKQGYGINIGSGCSDFVIDDVNVKGNLTGAIQDASTSNLKKISGSRGYVTQNKGVATVIVGQTVANVTHGLSVTPTAADIQLTFANSPSPRGVASVYLTSITATTFQIVSNAAVTTSDLSVAWSARVSGA